MSKEEPNGSHPVSKANKPSTMSSRFHSLIPPWLTESIHNSRTWKNFIRSLIATFASMVLMVSNKSLNALGVAAFFGLIASTILPPSMPLALYLMALTTLGLGMLLGWAWGVAAMAASLHVRSPALLQAQYASAEAAMNPDVSPAAQIPTFIFKGHFLDPRSSAVIGAFLFIGCYSLGWIRAKSPLLVLLTIYATILLDLMCTMGPLFPVQQYMIASSMLKPAAAYMAIGIVCTIVLFPQTLSHLTIHALVHKTLQPLHELLMLQDELLSTEPSNRDAWTSVSTRVTELSNAFLTAFGGLEGQAKMLQLEVSHGRISAGQLGEVVNRTRDLASKALGLGALALLVEDRNNAAEHNMAHTTSRITRLAKAFEDEERNGGRTLDDLLPLLKESTAELRLVAQDALQSGINWLGMINNTRWKKTPADFPPVEERQAKLQRLREVLREFRSGGTKEILAPFEEMFDMRTGKLKESYATRLTGSSRSLFRCFTFTATLVGFCSALIKFLELLLEIELGTPKNKFQFPGKFVQEVVRTVNDNTTERDLDIQDHLLDRGDDDDDRDDHSDDDLNDKTKAKKKARKYPRDPDARTPTNAFQRFGRLLSRIWRGLRGDNGLFALKYGIVSVALWVPAVCTNSAEFYYMNRGLWALIMAQTGLGVFAGEQVYNFVTRMSGTLVGAAFGMVAWYIGAQKGIGNAYGVTAATMVVTAPFLFMRVAAPMQSMSFWLMSAVTIVFIVGYSWVDMHLPQTANQGAGASLAGRRALLVIIGFAGSLFMVLFPHPISAKVVVRQGISKNIAAICELYGLEISALEEAREDGFVRTPERRERYRSHFLRIFKRISAIKQRIAFATLEPNVRGPWPKDLYLKLVKTQSGMLASSALLASAYSQLEPSWCARLTDDAELLAPPFTADVFSLFAILRHSLREGDALPPLMPIYERLAYHRERGHRIHLTRGDESETSTLNGNEDDDLLRSDAAVIASLRTLKHDVTWQTCHEEQFTVFATALIAISHLVSGLNKLHGTVLELVGERELEGFDAAQERWAQAERWDRTKESV